MSRRRLLAEFDRLAEAPGAIENLRQFVLELAVRGKLTQREASDGPVGQLLVEIDNVRTQKGSERRERTSAAVRRDETPFEIPKQWAWTRLSDIAAIVMGHSPPGSTYNKNGDGMPLINGPVEFTEGPFGKTVVNQYTTEPTNVCEEGDLLLCVRGSTTGRTNIAAFRACIGRGVAAIQPYGAAEFVHLYIWRMRASIIAMGRGIAFPSVSRKQIEDLPVPLPPLAEQRRIVAKVDELMTLCDRLEAAQAERERRRDRLAAGALRRLGAGKRTDVSNAIELLERAISGPFNSATFRSTILNLAVRGRLAAQNAADERAELLIDRIAEERKRLAEGGIIKLGGAVEPIEQEEAPFELPLGWTWARFAQVAAIQSNLVDPRDHPTAPHIAPDNIESATGRLLPYQTIAESKVFSAKHKFSGGGLLYSKIRPALAKVVSVDFDGLCSADMYPILPFIDREFLHQYMLSDVFVQQSVLEDNRVAMPKINQASLAKILVPVPPLPEQLRIASTVKQLMPLVDGLAAQSARSRSLAASLLSLLLSDVLADGGRLRGNATHAGGTSVRGNDSSGQTTPDVQTDDSSQSPAILGFALRRFAMKSGYRSLGEFDSSFHDEARGDAPSPICLVGLNGSGKSNLIEALADVFCYLEFINLPWKKSKSSGYRSNPHRFELEYVIQRVDGEYRVRIRKSKQSGVDFCILDSDDQEVKVPEGVAQLNLLPRRIIGYSSGHNETVTHPFLRTRTIYSEEVSRAALPASAQNSKEERVYDTRTLAMDYESNVAILLSNYLMRKPNELRLFEKFLRLERVASFRLRFNRKRAGKGTNALVWLTPELESYLERFVRCAGQSYDPGETEFDLYYELTPATISRFRHEFGSPGQLFLAMYKWSMLNDLMLSEAQRKTYLRADMTNGGLERPPSVPVTERIFNVMDVRLLLASPAIEIGYSGLSDGEHQFVQVFGTILLFDEPGTLFLFDEPESHFNPEWRTRFNEILQKLPNAHSHEYVVSTHSPYIVSGSKGQNVFHFTRNENEISFNRADFETYGATFDVILKRLFSIDSMINRSARAELEEIIRSGDVEKMEGAIGDFAESSEKRRLYQAILERKEGRP